MPEHASRFVGLYDQQNENRIPDWGGDELFTRMPSRRAVDDGPAPRFRPSLVVVDAPAERRRTPPGEEWSGPRDRRRPRSSEDSIAERAERRRPRTSEDSTAERAERRRPRSSEESIAERAERPGLSVVESGAAGVVHPPNKPDEPRADESVAESPAIAGARRWEAQDAAARWDGALDPPPERAPNGRRTTLITGRPDGGPRVRPLSLVAAERRRPRKTPTEWIGARPERIVAWAFVLGLLLILLAISSADAATI
jgi:hypothetical protein